MSSKQIRQSNARPSPENVLNSGARIAVIAGGGDLPLRICSKLDELNRDYVCLSIAGFGPEEFEQFEIGSIGKMLGYIRETQAKSILFCGYVKRPSFFSLKLDGVGKKWLSHLGIKSFLGDNALLTGIKKLILREGFQVISPHSILNTLLTPSGVLTTQRPTDLDLQDIARGIFVLNTLSKTDVGQAVIVQEGVVLGIEAAEGTSSLISRCVDLKLNDRGGVLVKTSKIGQDTSIDLPTIGPQTVRMASECGLSGIALGTGNSQIIDYSDTIDLANEKGTFIIGI
ncbi:MAG: UDP-2,3-diacylglucosamine diphosphatase LpxI [Holosporales bacterium]|jgi:DUF1009 family protein|nr:UDP-2,3-diacylglucosamine diphosphatase LpxI [Holosporales bacterium]